MDATRVKTRVKTRVFAETRGSDVQLISGLLFAANVAFLIFPIVAWFKN
jgi:hypothetical protein